MTENELLRAYGVPLHKASQAAISSPAAYSIGVEIKHDTPRVRATADEKGYLREEIEQEVAAA